MPADVTPFASKSPSCFSWTPEQMLEALLAEIRAGTVVPDKGMVIVFGTETPDGGTQIRSWRAQLGWTEEFAYLAVEQQNTLDSKRRSRV